MYNKKKQSYVLVYVQCKWHIVSTRKREKENTIEILSGWNFKLDRNFWTTLRTTTSYRYACILLWFHVCSPKHTHSEAAFIWSISPMMMKISLAFFLLMAITVDAGGKLIKCGFFYQMILSNDKANGSLICLWSE